MRTFLVLLSLLAGIGSAAAADLKLLTAGAYKPVALELAAEFEKKTGHKVTVENDTAGGLARRVSDGSKASTTPAPAARASPIAGSPIGPPPTTPTPAPGRKPRDWTNMPM